MGSRAPKVYRCSTADYPDCCRRLVLEKIVWRIQQCPQSFWGLCMPNANDIKWFKEQIHQEIETALAGTPFDLDMLVAIACKETGYIWSILRRKPLTTAEIVALCVGDTLDADRGRRAFPKTKAELVAKPNGRKMFDIARSALVAMARYVPGYAEAGGQSEQVLSWLWSVSARPSVFFAGPAYFLKKKYENFGDTLAQCLNELRSGLRKLRFENKASLTDYRVRLRCDRIQHRRFQSEQRP